MTQPTCEKPSPLETVSLSERAKQFWSAAYYIRRAPHRDHEKARKILAHVAMNTTGKISDRAIKLLKETENE